MTVLDSARQEDSNTPPTFDDVLAKLFQVKDKAQLELESIMSSLRMELEKERIEI